MTESKGLTVPFLGKTLDALGLGSQVAALLDPSMSCATAAAVLPVSRALLGIIEREEENKKAERMTRVLEDVQRRLVRLEDAEKNSEPRVDLFKEILWRAVQDDDNRKSTFYGAIIQWTLSRASKSLDPAIIRMACEAVAQLTHPELRSFVSWPKYSGRLKLPRGFYENLTLARIHSAGLLQQTGVTSPQFYTDIGHMLANSCESEVYTRAEWDRLQS